MKRFTWLVAFTIDETWVADGFEIDDERAQSMIESACPFACGHEVRGRVVKSPPASAIKAVQSGYDEVEPHEVESRQCRDCDGKGFTTGDGFSDDTHTCGSCGGCGLVPCEPTY